MLNTFFEDKKDLLTIEEFAQYINTTEDKVLEYISKGVLFPIVEIKSGYYVRRIPSLLTEFLSEVLQISDHDAYNSLLIYNSQHNELYTEYCAELAEFSENNKKDKLLSPMEMMPWKSDVLITENSFVYAQPDAIMDTQFGRGFLPQFITNDHPRFNIAGVINEDLYMNFLNSDYKIDGKKIIINGKAMDIGIGNRALGGIDTGKPICYFPDENSIEFAAYKCKQHFPLPIHLAINTLQLENIAFKECGTSYDELSILISQKLISLFSEKDKINFDLFNDLIILGMLSDRWVQVGYIYKQNEYLDRHDFSIPFDSRSIYINKAQQRSLQNLSGWGPYTLVEFKKSIFDAYKLRNYMIYNKYLYYIHKKLKDDSDTKEFDKKIISRYLNYCFENVQDDLSNNEFFCANAYHTGTTSTKIIDNSKPYASQKIANVGDINKQNTLDKILKNGNKPATELEPKNIDKNNNAHPIPMLDLFVKMNKKK